jgi:hypothetical protein
MVDVLSAILIATVAFTFVAWMAIQEPRPPLLQKAGALFLSALLLEIGGLVTRLMGWNNNIAYNLFQPLEFLLLLRMVRSIEPSLVRLVRLIGALGLIACGWSIYSQRGLQLLSVNAILVFGVLLTILIARLLFFMAKKSAVSLQKLPEFWFFLGCLLYFSGIVPVIGGIRLVYDYDPVLAATLWSVVPILAILRYGLATVACLLART